MSKVPYCLDCGTRLSQEPWAPDLCPRCSLQLALEHSPVEMDIEEDPEALPTREFPGQSLSPGQILGSRFQIRSLLGRGGMGEVWRAYDLKLRVDVALKTLRAELLEKERALQALRHEVRTAREVISPNVCRVFDLVELDGQELVSMEYIDGTTLVTVLQSRGPLELQEAREIASQFLAGLEAIHQAGLVHRDLKPENVMITRSGRVVVMDFGIAKGLADRKTGTVSGTPAYMAPEQARGEVVNARADVFSAGMVLAEMIAPNGIKNLQAREAIWQGIHQEPPELPDSPWVPVLEKAVARFAEQRYPSAAALARALEEVTLQVEGAEDVRPYPGLASFTEEGAEYFFGRELEVEAMWKKLRRPHLLGLIGPSGAGKSSFLRAGLLPVMPEGWRAVICNPGAAPFQNLARALVPEFSGDTEATKELLSIEKLDVALSILKRWRQHHTEVLVIVDQFEELFTLNAPEAQQRFAELLGRLAVETDVHVLLSMRDDFLYHCHSHEPLHPLLSELTLLGPPTGAALRRAVVQPALKCGYRFEDESLVEEILTEVEDERGALPMLAFAASRLWEHRDRDKGLLTKEAYEHIGGVGGALAQHAEATLEKIGTDLIPIVREIFRNLVTAQGTRAAREREELLSVFEDKDAAENILRELIDARLLTTYDVPAAEDEESGRTRVEIIHESLLTAWPRLVRWRTQDQEGAQLRDELRQAAQLWEQRNRSADRLWTGTAFREFQLWRERYSGGLTTTEEAFARAMVERASRQRRRRRFAVASIITFLLGVLAVVGVSRQQAVWHARRAEASRLVALGRLEMERYPTATLAYACKSLEVADNLEARRLAVEALWRGPTPRILPIPNRTWSAAFSPDGRWLAARTFSENVLLFQEDGSAPVVIGGYVVPRSPTKLAFTPEGDALLTSASSGARMVSVPDGREIRLLGPESPSGDRTGFWEETLPQAILLSVPEAADPDVFRHEIWPFDGEAPQIVGSLRTSGSWYVDPGVSQIALQRGERIFVRPLTGPATTPEREIATVAEGSSPSRPVFSPHGDRLAVAESTGRLALWPLDPDAPREPRVLHHEDPDRTSPPAFDAEGSRLVWGSASTVSLWRLDGPPSADPLVLRRGDVGLTKQGVFHPGGDWLAVPNHESITLWATRQTQPFVLRGHNSQVHNVSFTNDSKWLISCGQNAGVHTWPIDPAQIGVARLNEEGRGCNGLAVAPDGGQILLGGPGTTRVVSSSGGEARVLTGRFPDGGVAGVAFDPSGRRAALSIRNSPGPPKKIRIWDLESDALVRELTVVPPGESGSGTDWAVNQLDFTPEGELLAAGERGIRRFDTETGRSEWIWRLERGWEASMGLSQDGRRLLAVAFLLHGTGAENNPVVLFDLAEGTRRPITSHGDRVRAVALDPTGTIVVTGGEQGAVRVGPADDGEPHLLLGHSESMVPISRPLTVSPDGRWIASAAGSEIRLWPMPDLTKPPLHTLPLDQLLGKLRELTNLRVIEDEASPTGYRLEIGPFPGWETVPVW